jgi:RHS repeat-associated protein
MYLTNFHFYPYKNYLYSKPVKGLRGCGVSYGFAFNGQEKDDEVSGAGNTLSAEFWEYDSRLGRRWNIDPVVHGNQSGFICFSNNPIIFIDPNGRTDYYNNKGKWIGTDGIDNGVKLMAISTATARIIKKATKENMVISMNTTIYKDIVQIPNQQTMEAMPYYP